MTEDEFYALTSDEMFAEIAEGWSCKEDLAKWVAYQCKIAIENATPQSYKDI